MTRPASREPLGENQKEGKSERSESKGAAAQARRSELDKERRKGRKLTRLLSDLQKERSDWMAEIEGLDVRALTLELQLAGIRRRQSETVQERLRPAEAARSVRLMLARGLLAGYREFRWSLGILSSPRRLQSAALILGSGLFDADYFKDLHPETRRSRVDALLHYLASGWQNGWDPNPLFDCRYYLARNPDVRSSGREPLTHYIRTGNLEGRNPHPLFDHGFYCAQVPELRRTTENPLWHYLTQGARDGLSPHPRFNATYYLIRYPEVAALGTNPLVHFIRLGATETRDPNPLFSTSRYLDAYPDVASAGMNPLVHYLGHGEAEGRRIFPPESTPDIRLSGPESSARFVLKKQPAAQTPEQIPTILCVTHVVPFPPRAGNEYRLHRLLRWLRSQGHRIVLLAAPLLDHPLDEALLVRNAEEYGNVVLVQRDGSIFHLTPEFPDLMKALDRRRVFSVSRALAEERYESHHAQDLLAMDRGFCHDAVAALALHLQSALQPTAILALYIWMTRFLPLVGPDVLKIIDTLDAFSLKRQKVGDFGLPEIEIDPHEEAERLNRADLVMAIQDAERQYLAALVPDRPVITVGVDFEVPAYEAPSKLPKILLVGSDNPMNKKGLKDFLRFAWPGILGRVPTAELLVAGGVGGDLIFPPRGVSVLGPVDDLTPFYRDARVVVNPAVAGTGLKIKTIEALCHSRKVVSWPAGVEGLVLELAHLCPVAHDWYEFTQKLLVELEDSPRPFSPADLALVREALGPDRAYAQLGAVLKKHFRAEGARLLEAVPTEQPGVRKQE